MTRGEFACGLAMASPVWFLASGAFVHLVPAVVALALGGAVWISAGSLLVRALKKKPASQRR